jgi:aldehyde dehydrogenase (NAD+)
VRDYLQFYIDGRWVEPASARTLDVINPATEQVAGRISLGAAVDVDRAVAAARRAFASFSLTSKADRLGLLQRILREYERRFDAVAAAITEEMGAPSWFARQAQADIGRQHLRATLTALDSFEFAAGRGSTRIVREPIGVCGFIVPWNWPINQIVCKVAPALATGCTMVLKPSELAPFSAQLWSEIMDCAGVPAGVYNAINGDGPTVGAAIASHVDIDMVSFTGSTRAGVQVAKSAADTIKRVQQELGGKSPNIVLADADLESSIAAGVRAVMLNSGQSCNAPTRLLVPRTKLDAAIRVAQLTAESISVGDPLHDAQIGPVVSAAHWDRIQALIERGIEEGATLVAGGPGKPAGLERGYYVKPTVFAHVRNDMTIAREEIFGPVVAIIGYDSVDDAVTIANDTEYGLAAYVQGADVDVIRSVAARLRAGQVIVNDAPRDLMAPFGGYKRSGNGREWGDHALAEFLETKAIIGYEVASDQAGPARNGSGGGLGIVRVVP